MSVVSLESRREFRARRREGLLTIIDLALLGLVYPVFVSDGDGKGLVRNADAAREAFEGATAMALDERLLTAAQVDELRSKADW
jgi:hypothetical protein